MLRVAARAGSAEPFAGRGRTPTGRPRRGRAAEAGPPQGCAAARELSEKLESLLDEVLVELEHPAVPGVGIEDELAARESSVEVDGVLGGHHLVALTVHGEHGLVDAREVRRLLLTPSVDGLELGAEGADGDGLVAVAGTFLQPGQELLAGSAPVRRSGEEEELLGVLAGEQSSGGVEVGDAGHLVDAFAPGRASA